MEFPSQVLEFEGNSIVSLPAYTYGFTMPGDPQSCEHPGHVVEIGITSVNR